MSWSINCDPCYWISHNNPTVANTVMLDIPINHSIIREVCLMAVGLQAVYLEPTICSILCLCLNFFTRFILWHFFNTYSPILILACFISYRTINENIRQKRLLLYKKKALSYCMYSWFVIIIISWLGSSVSSTGCNPWASSKIAWSAHWWALMARIIRWC